MITNLLSAIPWIGQDFVEFPIYAILFIFRVYTLFTFCDFELKTIGKIDVSKLRGQKTRRKRDKIEYSNISYGFLSIFIGFIDGDGYLQITKSGKNYIRMQLVISVDMRDLELLKHFYEVLKIGRINVYPNINTAKYIISKTDLQEVIFPLIFYHNIFFFTDIRRKQFDICIYLLNNNIVKFDLIPKHVPTVFAMPNTSIEYCKLPFFNNYLVGFTIAEGSFYVKASGEHCFSVRQRNEELLFQAIKQVFQRDRKIGKEGKYIQLSISSAKDLKNVQEFFNRHYPILGYKAEQYKNFCDSLKIKSKI